MSCEHHAGFDCEICWRDRVEVTLQRIAAALEPKTNPDEPPLIDGCRIVNRGDGNYVCRVHFRYWPIGSGICPGRNAR
jgi:hypothetical protein